MACTCFILPSDVLSRLAQDKGLDTHLRKSLFDTAQISHELRDLRNQAARFTCVALAHAGYPAELAISPMVTVYNCKHTSTPPGVPVPHPQKSSDQTAKRTFNETTSVAKFYKDVFNRNS